ncbi:uncharacterized protein J8A68_003795 [[Candida] subhashii]|uniref:DUF3020 domain-containing protein n=1 Tax=[Candida] subhashii TaxID=561895 RepID=A0A8J5QUA0_9ASCO|nr:uncharacterized protein J8A68_003795 [[Candida] subhashii]KAG7662665.1 hypothetical protein J8A68_003795 [[Candida] subhashii]
MSDNNKTDNDNINNNSDEDNLSHTITYSLESLNRQHYQEDHSQQSQPEHIQGSDRPISRALHQSELENAIGNVFDQFDFQSISNHTGFEEGNNNDDDTNIRHNEQQGHQPEESETSDDRMDVDEVEHNKEGEDNDDDDDMDLDDAIGDAFNDVFNQTEADTIEDSNVQSRDTDTSQIQQESSEDRQASEKEHSEHLEDDLEGAIGDAFGEVFNQATTHQNRNIEDNKEDNSDIASKPSDTVVSENNDTTIAKELSSTIPSKENHRDNELEDAIGEALGDVFNHEVEVSKESHGHIPSTKEKSEDELEDAIGDAFNEAIQPESQGNENKEVQADVQASKSEPEDNLEDAIGEAFSNVFQQVESTSKDISADKAEKQKTDENLEDAIGEAFNNVFVQEEAVNKEVQQKENEQLQSNEPVQEGIIEDKNVDTVNNVMKQSNAEEDVGEKDESQQPGTEQSEENLEDAIGEAFNNVFEQQKQDDENKSEQEKDVIPSTQEKSEENLEDAIGEAFNNVFNKESIESNQSHNEPVSEAEKEESLNDAIGDAFTEVLQKQQSDTVKENDKVVENREDLLAKPEEEDEDNLEDAIGDAFKNIFGKSTENLTESKEDVAREVVQETTIIEKETEEPTASHEEEQDILESSIGDALKSSFEQKVVEAVSAANKDVTASDNSQLETEASLEGAIDDAFKNAFAKEVPATEVPEKEEIKEPEDELSEAIGSALSDLIQKGDMEPTKGMEVETQTTQKDATEEDLDEAIGNAFENLLASERTKTTQTDKKLEPTQHDDDMDLEDAIGDAFKSILPPEPEKTQVIEREKSLPLPAEEVDNELENAIGDAFKSISGLVQEKKSQGVDDEELDQMISASFQQVFGGSSNQGPVSGSINKDQEDIQMEGAIAEAFMSAMQTSTKAHEKSRPQPQRPKVSAKTLAAQAAAAKAIRDNAIHNLAVKISHQVQDHLNDDKAFAPLPFVSGLPQIDEGVLDYFQNEANKENDKPSSSANANVPSNSQLQAAITSAVKTAIDAVSAPQGRRPSTQDNTVADVEQLQMNDILQNAFKMALENPQELISDLEIDSSIKTVLPPVQPPQLPPAVSKPSLPKSKVSKAKAGIKPPIRFQKPVESMSTKKATTPEPVSTLGSQVSSTISNLQQSLKRPTASIRPSKIGRLPAAERPKPQKKKDLSIASSLAIQRSLISGPRKDYSAIESMEDAVKSDRTSRFSKPLSSQISSVIQSLTSRISSGEISDTSILTAIREMTDALSSGGNLSSFLHKPMVAEEIISGYKAEKDRNSMVHTLSLAKKFVDSQPKNNLENVKASTMIEDALEQFKRYTTVDQIQSEAPKESSSSSTSQPGEQSQVNTNKTFIEKQKVTLSATQSDFISSITNSVIETIVKYSPESRFSSETLAAVARLKAQAQTPEHMKKLRFENRERKQKWREENQERNKDNDLRQRVLKKATAIFGEIDSPEKAAWAEREFEMRKQKRIDRQKKEEKEKHEQDAKPTKSTPIEDEPETKTISEDEEEKNRIKDTDTIAQDPAFFKPINDLFHIFSGSRIADDSQAMLVATAAATSTAASLYWQNHREAGFRSVDSAITTVLRRLMDDLNKKGSFKYTKTRIPLKKATPPSSPAEDIMKRYSLSSSFYDLDIKDKRAADNVLGGDYKRYKTTEEMERESRARIAASYDQIRNSMVGPRTSWGSLNSLKMPQYKKATTEKFAEPEEKSPMKVPKESPFISNKVPLSTNTVNQQQTSGSGLRKPGSFQKPDAKNEKPRGTSLGFPRLYSASFTN